LLNEKQKGQLNKIEGMRRKLKGLMDKQLSLSKDAESAFDESNFNQQIKQCDKRTKELAESLRREEERAKESLRSKIEN